MSWFSLAVLSLATYRAARMVSRERGPFDVFSNFRNWVSRMGSRPKKTPKRRSSSTVDDMDITSDMLFMGMPTTWWAEGVSCRYCTSFWIACILSVSWVYGHDYVRLAIVSLAIAGGASLLMEAER